MGRHSDSDSESSYRHKKKKKRQSRSPSYNSDSSSRKLKKKKSKKSKSHRRSRSRSHSNSRHSFRSRSPSLKTRRSRSRSRTGSRRSSYDRLRRSRSRSYDQRRRSRSGSYSRSRRSRSRSYEKSRYRSRSRSKSRRRSRSADSRRRRSRSCSRSRRSRSSSRDRRKKSKSPGTRINEDKSNDPAASIPGYEDMTPAEKAEARMRMALKAAAAADEKIKAMSGEVPSRLPAALTYEEQRNRAKALEEIESSGFTPATFTSSRSQQIKQETGAVSSEISHDAAIFGQGTSMGMNGSVAKTEGGKEGIMHPNLYVSEEDKMQNWVRKLAQMRKKKLEGDAMA